jgi:anaerobic magnesium-protoporphyrin IX monomethyl ester cyclase
MRFSRVLLVNLPIASEWPGLAPPIGLGYLAESLKTHGVLCDVADMNSEGGVRTLQRKIERFRPDLIGVSLITRDFVRCYRTLMEIRRRNPGLKIVAGGPHVTIFKEQVLEDCPAIDYGVTFEGEETLVELCSDRPAGQIKGLLQRSDGRVVYTGDREFASDLDMIPWPRYENFKLGRYLNEINLITSRGCPFHCIFCARHCLSPTYRARSAQNVGDELEYWHARGYTRFNIEDDNFNLDKKRVYAICDEIEKRKLGGITIRCSNGIRADRADRDVLKRMREVGFRYLAFGVDAGNDRMLKVVKKGETMADIEEAIKNACDLGYAIKLFFVVGNPTETREDVEDMVRLTRKYPVQEVHFNNTIPYPGTELYDWIEKHGGFLRAPDEFLNNASFWEEEPIFETPELPRAERIRLTRYLAAVRKEVHRKAIARLAGRHALLARVGGMVVTSSLWDKLYYRNVRFHKLAERFRYGRRKQAVGTQDLTERNL